VRRAPVNDTTRPTRLEWLNGYEQIGVSGRFENVPKGATSRPFGAPLQVFDEHLLDRLVKGAQHVPDAVPAHQMADLFHKVLGVVSGALQ